MTGPLCADCIADGSGQQIVEFGTRCTSTQDRAHVEFVEREQARAELALGGEPHPVAVPAERLGDAGDDPDLTAAIEIPVALGGFVGAHNRLGRKLSRDCRQDLVGRHDDICIPHIAGFERHELDEADLDAPLAAIPGEVHHFVVVDAAHHDRVDLHWVETGIDGRVDAVEHPVQLISASQLQESIALQRIEADVDARQASRRQRLGMQAQRGAVGGQCNVDAQLGEAFDQPRQMRAHQGLTARQTDALEAESLHAHLGESLDLLEAQDLRSRQPRHAFGWHAVLAAEVAPVGDGDAQVTHDPAERIDEIGCPGRSNDTCCAIHWPERTQRRAG